MTVKEKKNRTVIRTITTDKYLASRNIKKTWNKSIWERLVGP